MQPTTSLLKRLLNSLMSESDAPEASGDSHFDPAKFQMLFQFFPIGAKSRYYPEFQQRYVLRTIILGYRVNNHYLYTRDALLKSEDGQPVGFRIGPDKVLLLPSVRKFQILLPDTSEQERLLDYLSRAELGRNGQFEPGNTITLVGASMGQGVPTVDNTVDRRQTLNKGPYAKNQTILLTPDFATLAITDKRQKQRVNAGIPALLHFSNKAVPFECILGDFSELSLRVCITGPGQVMPPVVPGKAVTVDFDFGDIASTFSLRGKVFRRSEEFCVVKLEQIFRDGEFERIRMIDIMEIKTGILNLCS